MNIHWANVYKVTSLIPDTGWAFNNAGYYFYYFTSMYKISVLWKNLITLNRTAEVKKAKGNAQVEQETWKMSHVYIITNDVKFYLYS